MFKPIGDKIVAKALDNNNEQTSGGVILPDIAQEETMQAEVIAIGKGILLLDGKYAKPHCKVGDIIVYPKLGAKKMDYKGNDYIVLKENDILTILTGDK